MSQRENNPDGILSLRWRVKCMAVLGSSACSPNPSLLEYLLLDRNRRNGPPEHEVSSRDQTDKRIARIN